MPCTETDFAFLRELVYSQSVNQLDPRRDYLFETRLASLLHERGMSSIDELVSTLRGRPQPQLARAVAEAMTINETSFFRDLRPFELMRLDLLPELIHNRRHLRKLTFWSAACSSGQEAYSLAMLLREWFPAIADWKIAIVGTDLTAEVVERARHGQYARIEVNRGLPARMLVKYFDKTGDDWQVKPAIRSMCTFRQMSLNPPLGMRNEPFDAILLRNVMLYFSMETRRQLLPAVHRLLAPDGFLILGSSEQPANPELWQPILSRNTCYYRPRAAN